MKFLLFNRITNLIMVKIICKVKSGANQGVDDWSPHPDNNALLNYYNSNRKKFQENYEFTVQGVTIQVAKILEKSKSEIKFSFSN